MRCRWWVQKTIKLQTPHVIHDSGDRLTSSVNFLQNVIAWFSFPVDENNLATAFREWLRTCGREFKYRSARNQRLYRAVLGFEGDDTLGKVEKDIKGHAELFFNRWGWKEKLKYVEGAGDAALTFVGYEILTTDGFPVIEDVSVVCFPELKRCLTTKQWTVQQGTPAEICQASHLFALMMTHGFHGLAPMHAFFAALADDLRLPPGIEHKIDDDTLKKFSLYRHGGITDFRWQGQRLVSAMPETIYIYIYIYIYLCLTTACRGFFLFTNVGLGCGGLVGQKGLCGGDVCVKLAGGHESCAVS